MFFLCFDISITTATTNCQYLVSSCRRLGKRYGVIECDPLVYRGMVKTVSRIIYRRFGCISENSSQTLLWLSDSI